MNGAISIVTPAYHGEQTIARAVQSIIGQSMDNWELIIVADDQVDYEQVLGRFGIVDKRIRYLSTGVVGSGSPPARNIGLDACNNRFTAVLDADDFMHREKLSQICTALQSHGIVSTALQVVSDQLTSLRTVGAGPDRLLAAGAYKFTNISMDSMIAHDRAKADPRFDKSFNYLSDVEFLLKLFAANEKCFHIGAPLHTYVKQPQSISNKSGASVGLIATKERLIKLLDADYYPFSDPDGCAGFKRFFQTSLLAERAYEARLAAQPGLLFEDHLDLYLNADAGPMKQG